MNFGNSNANVPATKAQHVTFGSTGGGDAGLKLSLPNTGAPSFFSNPTTSLATTSSTAASAPTLQFGSITSSAPAPSLQFGSNTTSSAPAPTATIQFGGTQATTAANTTSSISSILQQKPAAPPANLSTATKTTDSSAAPTNTANQITYNQLEDSINKWTLELEEQEKVFIDQATQINAWDKLLINNNKKIIEFNESVQKLKAEQQTLEQELEFISTQHTELEESIAPLQKEFMKIPPADPERTQVYLLVENLDTQLKQMSEDLKEIIDNLNEAIKDQDNPDPIVQIGKILNAHMDSLQWIEGSLSAIGNKLEDLTKMHESFKLDSERSFRSAYYY